MAYGQGMMLDSIRNVLNRRQAARAEDDQFQLAQDRGESALERLRAQADMSTARAHAENDWRIRVANINKDARLGAADITGEAGIKRAGVTGEGFAKTAEIRGDKENEGRALTAAAQLARQQDKQGWETGENSLDRGSREGIGADRNASMEEQARIRARATNLNTEMTTGARMATSNDPVLRSLDAEIEGAQKKFTSLYQGHLDNLVKAKFKTRQEAEQEAFRLAKADLIQMGLDPAKIRETMRIRNEYRAKLQGQPQQQSSESTTERKTTGSSRPALR